MSFDRITDILKSEFLGEIKGINAALQLINECVIYSEADKKNYIDGDKLVRELHKRKKILMDRQTPNSQEAGLYSKTL